MLTEVDKKISICSSVFVFFEIDFKRLYGTEHNLGFKAVRIWEFLSKPFKLLEFHVLNLKWPLVSVI